MPKASIETSPCLAFGGAILHQLGLIERVSKNGLAPLLPSMSYYPSFTHLAWQKGKRLSPGFIPIIMVGVLPFVWRY
jgi:hypothetical protein